MRIKKIIFNHLEDYHILNSIGLKITNDSLHAITITKFVFVLSSLILFCVSWKILSKQRYRYLNINNFNFNIFQSIIWRYY